MQRTCHTSQMQIQTQEHVAKTQAVGEHPRSHTGSYWNPAICTPPVPTALAEGRPDRLGGACSCMFTGRWGPHQGKGAAFRPFPPTPD